MCEFEKKTVETGDIENGHETFVLYMFWILSQTYNKQPLSVPCLFFTLLLLYVLEFTHQAKTSAQTRGTDADLPLSYERTVWGYDQNPRSNINLASHSVIFIRYELNCDRRVNC